MNPNEKVGFVFAGRAFTVHWAWKRRDTRSRTRAFVFVDLLGTQRSRLIAKDMLLAALDALHFNEIEKATFSRNAGCNCGCSPGWILEGSYNKDIFINPVQS